MRALIRFAPLLVLGLLPACDPREPPLPRVEGDSLAGGRAAGEAVEQAPRAPAAPSPEARRHSPSPPGAHADSARAR